MSPNHLLLLECYLDILQPLLKWRVLSLDKIISETKYSGKMSNFYKRITKLEASGLIGSFINPSTKKKEIFLEEKGCKALGEVKMNSISVENWTHESVLSQLSYNLHQHHIFTNVMLEHEYSLLYPAISCKPDAILKTERNREITIALECELSQKSIKRVIEKYKFYNQNPYFNNVIYIFPLARVYNAYVNILKENEHDFKSERFIFLYSPDLYNPNLDLFRVEATHCFSKTTLNDLFSKRGRT